jgi:hypothetical protein
VAKRGQLSQQERAYITKHAYKKTPAEIGAKLDRTPETIQRFINDHVRPPEGHNADPEEVERIVIRQDLRAGEKWKRLQEELTAKEIVFFEEMYVELMGQFKNDVLPTEEGQIFNAIRFEILKSRNLVARRRALDDIERLEKTQTDFLATFGGDINQMGDADKAFALSLETQLQVARKQEQDRTNEYVKLQERLDKLMESLKATRDQRVKQIESSKVSFVEVIKVLNRRDVQEREGRQNELLRMASEVEYERLGRPHRYEDNQEDSPILSADTVNLGPEPIQEESDD